jgi:hypothetical protein
MFLFDHTDFSITAIGTPLTGEYDDYSLGDTSSEVAIELTPGGDEIVVGRTILNLVPQVRRIPWHDSTSATTPGTSSAEMIRFNLAAHRRSLTGKLDIAVQDDEKIVFTHSATVPSQADFSTYRLNKKRTLDTRWGSSGVVNTPFSDDAGAASLAIQPIDHKIVAAGTRLLSFPGQRMTSPFPDTTMVEWTTASAGRKRCGPHLCEKR